MNQKTGDETNNSNNKIIVYAISRKNSIRTKTPKEERKRIRRNTHTKEKMRIHRKRIRTHNNQKMETNNKKTCNELSRTRRNTQKESNTET